jgi:hypothetical protein
LAVGGLWQALAAEAGTDPRSQTLHDIRAAHGTRTAYEIYLAAQAAHGNVVTCGTPQPSAPGQLSLTAPGSLTTVTIPISQFTALTLTTTCP